MRLTRYRNENALKEKASLEWHKAEQVREYYKRAIAAYVSNANFVGLGLSSNKYDRDVAIMVVRALRYRGVKLLLHKGTTYWKIIFDTESYFGSEPSREVS